MATQVGSIYVDLELRDNLTRDLNRAKGNLNSFSASLTSLGADVTKLGLGLTAIGAIATKAFYEAGQAAIAYESAFAGVIKTVDGTEEQLSALSDTIRTMATDMDNPLAGLDDAAVTLAKIGELGGQLGVPLDSLDEFIQVIGELTLSTDLTAESASLMLAQFANITGLDFADFDRLGATIVDLGNNMATTESQIVEFMQRLAGAGASFGFTEAQIAALSATMASLGINAESGGSAMTRVFTEISNAVTSGGVDLQAFANISGLSSAEFAQSWQNEPIDALEAFITGLGRMDAASRELAFAELGLDGIRVADALRRMSNESALFTESLGIANSAWADNTALTNEAQKRFETTEAQLNLLKNTINDLAIEIGNVFLPIINDVVKDIVPLIRGFAQWAGENPKLVLGVMALGVAVGGLGAVLTAAGAVLVGVGFIISSPFLLPLLAATSAVALFGAAVTTNFMGIRDAAEQYLSPVADFLGGVSDFFGGGSSNIQLEIAPEPEILTDGVPTLSQLQEDFGEMLPESVFVELGLELKPFYEPLSPEAEAKLKSDWVIKQRQLAKTIDGSSQPIEIKFEAKPRPEVQSNFISQFAFEAGEMISQGVSALGGITPVGWAINLSQGGIDASSFEGLRASLDTALTQFMAGYNIFDIIIGQPFREGAVGFDPSVAIASFINAVNAQLQSGFPVVMNTMASFGVNLMQAFANAVTGQIGAILGIVQGAIDAVIPDTINIQLPAITAEQLASFGIGTLMDGGASIGLSTVVSFGAGLLKAQGGPVMGNQPYIIGEKGPEVFVPESSGTIIPNHRGGMNSGGTGGVYIETVIVQGVESYRELAHKLQEVGRQSAPSLVGM